LKDKAVELRAQAEEQEKLLDFTIDLFKAGIEILANPEEGAANAAAHVFTGALKFFHENDLAKQAEEAEKEAAALHRESVTAVMKRARKATDELTSQIDKIGPLSDEVAASIERNVMRATKRFDTVDAPAHRVKFRFGDLEQAIQKAVPLTQAARNAAGNRYRSVWAGAEALLNILRTNLSTVDKDDYYGHAKSYKFDQGLSWNRELLDEMTAHIQQMSTQCYEQAQSSNKILSDLLSLNARAFSALKKART